MSSPAVTIRIPDLLEAWPILKTINPCYLAVSKESEAWFESLGLLNDRFRIIFNKCNSGIIVAMAYPKASRDHLRSSMDMMNCFLLIDEMSDKQSKAEVAQASAIIMSVLRYVNHDESLGANVTE